MTTMRAAAEIRGVLAARAFAFDDPVAYMAGVDEALGCVRAASAPDHGISGTAWVHAAIASGPGGRV